MEYYTNNVMPRAIYTKDHNVIVERLKKARFESGLGQVEASKKLGKTQSYLSKIESGRMVIDYQPVNLNSIILELKSVFQMNCIYNFCRVL